MNPKRLGVIVLLLVVFSVVVPAHVEVAAEQQIYTIEEGQSITLSFTNPTNQSMTIQVKNLDYPADKVPLWISPTTIPPNSTVSVIVHFYITNDNVKPGTYAVAVYTSYQSFLIYLKKTAATQTSNNDAQIQKLYDEINNLQASIKQLIQFYEQRYNDLYNQLQALKSTQNGNDKQINQMEQELTLLKTQLNELNKQLTTMNQLVIQMQKTVQTDDKNVAAFNTKLQQYDKLLAEYDKKISVIDAALKQIDIDKYKELDQRVSALEKKQAAMEQAVAEAKSAASQSYSQVSVLSAKVSDTENKLNYALIAGLAGVVALAMVFSNGNLPFRNNGNGRRNGGLPRKRYQENIVPPGVSPKAAQEVEKLTVTREELEKLVEEAKVMGKAEAMAELLKQMAGDVEEEGGDE